MTQPHNLRTSNKGEASVNLNSSFLGSNRNSPVAFHLAIMFFLMNTLVSAELCSGAKCCLPIVSAPPRFSRVPCPCTQCADSANARDFHSALKGIEDFVIATFRVLT